MKVFYDLFRFLQALAEAKSGKNRKDPQISGDRQVYDEQVQRYDLSP